jgi:hypothetical protein
MTRSPPLIVGWLLVCGLPPAALAQDSPPQPEALPTKGAAQIIAISGNTVTIQNETGATRTLQLSSVQRLKPGMRTGWCEDDCRVLSVAIPMAAVALGKPSEVEPRAPEAQATIVAIKGNTVIIRGETGATRSLQLQSTEGLKPGMPTSWCEEDCRLLNIQTEYRVRRVAGLRR